MNIFQDGNGNYSSKRTLGVIYMLGAFIMGFLDQVTKFEINSFEVWVTILGTGCGLLGIGLFDGKGKSLNVVATVDPDKEEVPDEKG